MMTLKRHIGRNWVAQQFSQEPRMIRAQRSMAREISDNTRTQADGNIDGGRAKAGDNTNRPGSLTGLRRILGLRVENERLLH
eukprot:3725081-Pyramimonas_sp.AAC.1